MKEASGELNMTIVTIMAIAAILAFAVVFVPKILNTVSARWNESADQGQNMINDGAAAAR